MTTKHSLPARLKAARKAAGYKTAKAFIKTHKIPPSTYSQHETGRRAPDEKTLRHYSKLFGVNSDWLTAGEGSPYGYKKHITEKKEILSGEMLDLAQLQASAKAINEKLLAAILMEILKLNLSGEKTAKAAAGIYTDIVSVESSSELQMRMVAAAVLSFKRYQLK